MRYLLILLVLIYSCSRIFYPEPQLEKIKIYMGKYERSIQAKDYTAIQTSHVIILLKENPDIPVGVWCYIKRKPCRYPMHPDIAWQIERQFFTWQGSDKEYRLHKNIKLKIYY